MTRTERRPPPKKLRAGSTAMFLLVWIPYALLVYRCWFVIDDAFISFRYAQNWAEGHGLRYNLGEHPPEEGYTNFLWVAFCGVVEFLGGSAVVWAPLVSFLAGSVLLYVLFRTMQDDLGLCRAAALLSAFSLGVFPSFAIWSTGGLATMPFALAFVLTVRLLVLRPEGAAPIWAGLSGSALALLRFEGFAWVLVIGAVGLVSRRMRKQPAARPLAAFFAIVSCSFAVYFAWRYGYYQHLLPNPVNLKVHFGPEVALRGFRYVVSFFLTFVTPVLILPALLYAFRNSLRPVGGALVVLALAVFAYAIVVGGDWMPMWRFLIPGLAVGALLSGLLLHELWTRYPRQRALVAGTVILVSGLGLLPAWNVHLVPDSIRETFRYRYGWPDMTEQEIWYRWVEVLDGVRDVSIALNEYGKRGDSLVADSIGIIGYYTDFFIYDQFGLVTREVLALPRGGPLIAPPGLDHRVPSDFFDRHQPTFLRWSIVQCSPADETCSLGQVVIEKAEGWRREVRLLFRRYAPDFSSLPPEPQNGSARVLVVLRAIEEDPSLGIDRLPRRERRRERGRRSRVLWEDFFERARALP